MEAPKGFETSRGGQSSKARSWIHRIRDKAVKAAKGATTQAARDVADDARSGLRRILPKTTNPVPGPVAAVAPGIVGAGYIGAAGEVLTSPREDRLARGNLTNLTPRQLIENESGTVGEAVGDFARRNVATAIGAGVSLGNAFGAGSVRRALGITGAVPEKPQAQPQPQPQPQPQAQPQSQAQVQPESTPPAVEEFYGERSRGPARPFQVQDGTRSDYRDRLRALQGDALRERILGELDNLDSGDPQRAEMWRSLRQRILGTNTQAQAREGILENSQGRAGMRRVAGQLENASSYNDQMQARYDARMLLESANRSKYRATAKSKRDAAAKLLEQARALRGDDLSAQANAGTLYGTDAGIDEQQFVTDSENQRANAMRAREMLGVEADLLRAEDTHTNNINDARRYLLDSARSSQDNERRDMSSLETNQITNAMNLRNTLLRERGANARAQATSNADSQPKATLKTQQKLMTDLASAESREDRENLLELFSRMAQQGDIDAQQVLDAEAVRELRRMTSSGFAGLGAPLRDVARVVDVNNPILEPRWGSSRSLTDRILQPTVNLDNLNRLAVDPNTGRLIQFNGDDMTQSRVADIDELPVWMQRYFAARLPVYNKE